MAEVESALSAVLPLLQPPLLTMHILAKQTVSLAWKDAKGGKATGQHRNTHTDVMEQIAEASVRMITPGCAT